MKVSRSLPNALLTAWVLPMSTEARAAQLSWLGDQISWLSPVEALEVYDYAVGRMNPMEYALSDEHVTGIEFSSSREDEGACEWVAERISKTTGRLFVVFGRKEVLSISLAPFLEHWPNMFGPEDVMILDEGRIWVLFNYHEMELHFGKIRK